jgi:hypothetical protein
VKHPEISQQNSSTKQNPYYTVSIFNLYGILQKQKKCLGDSFTIPVYNLKDGTYIIKIDNGKTISNNQLIIKH